MVSKYALTEVSSTSKVIIENRIPAILIIYISTEYCFLFLICWLDDGELNRLLQFSTFAVKVYLKHWFTCSLAAEAPKNDLQLIIDLKEYRTVNSEIADAALKKFSGHYWYFGDMLSGLSFFDARNDEIKLVEMVSALNRTVRHERNILRNTDLKWNTIHNDDLDIVKFINANTRRFFKVLGNENPDFLRYPPSSWCENESYVKMSSIIKNLTVVNDPAERAIGLIKNVNNNLTMNREQQSHLVQVIENFRHNHPDSKKSTILKNLPMNLLE